MAERMNGYIEGGNGENAGKGGYFDSYHPYALTTIVCWALAFALTRISLRHFTALPIGFMRYGIASAVLVYIVFKYKISRPRIADLPYFILSGLTGYFIYVTAFNIGSITVNASTSSIMIATAPIMTAFMARIVYKEKLSWVQWAAIFVEFAGIVLLTSLKGGFVANEGILWLLLAAFSFCIYNLTQRKLVRRYTGLQSSAYSIFAGTIMLSIFMPEAAVQLWHAPMIAVVCVAIMGVFSSALAYVSWSKALERAGGVTSVSNYLFLSPLLSTIFGFVIAKEVPDFATMAGGTVIMAGLFLFYFGPKLFRRKHIHLGG